MNTHTGKAGLTFALLAACTASSGGPDAASTSSTGTAQPFEQTPSARVLQPLTPPRATRVAGNRLIVRVQRGTRGSFWLQGEVYRGVTQVVALTAESALPARGITFELGAMHGGGRWVTVSVDRDATEALYMVSAQKRGDRLRAPAWLEVVALPVVDALVPVDEAVLRYGSAAPFDFHTHNEPGPLLSFCNPPGSAESVGFASAVEVFGWGPSPTGEPDGTLVILGENLPVYSKDEGQDVYLDVYLHNEDHPNSTPAPLEVLDRSHDFIQVQLPHQPVTGKLELLGFGVGDSGPNIVVEQDSFGIVNVCPREHVAFHQVLDDSYDVIAAPGLADTSSTHWVAGAPATQHLNAQIFTGEQVSNVTLAANVQRRTHGGGWGNINLLQAEPLSGQPLLFQVDASVLSPHQAEQFRYWWVGQLTRADGSILTLSSEPALFYSDCPSGPQPDLVDMANTVAAVLGMPLTTAMLNARGYILNNHGHIAVQGIGVSFIKAGNAPPDLPGILFTVGANGADLTDDQPDEPYTVVGWGHGAVWPSQAQPPQPLLGCVPYHEWFIHEAGWHTPDDGGMVLDVPPYNPLMPPQAAIELGASPDNWHPRFWDTHYWWDGPGTMPWMSIFHHDASGALIPATGVATPNGMFFYPD